ncbi:MAG: PHP domain-containing protein [Chloroflexi bacterium]|nr:PHP domain-containing protein [Chloroflexota bacterium]
MAVDLHLHTTASDGRLSPTELVRRAGRKGLRVIAITDHDSTEGLDEAMQAAQQFPQLTIIPGIELSTDIPKGEIHILAYGIDPKAPTLQELLREFRAARLDRGRRMVEKLAELGMPIPWERVLELAQGGAVGRPHVAQAMLEAGWVSSISEAFDLWIGRTGPAYAERPKLTPVEAVQMVKRLDGVTSLAHPADIPNLEDTVADLAAAGLSGIEAHYYGYAREYVDYLCRLAERHHLVPTGGSDCHGIPGGAGGDVGEVAVPLASAERLMALIRQRKGTASAVE